MKFAEHDIPKPIFFYLSMEYSSFSFPESDPVSIFFYDFCSIPFSDPVTEIIPEHSTEDGERYGPDEVILPPESSHEDHHIHPRYSSPDDGE